jgi:hypothetical protein
MFKRTLRQLPFSFLQLRHPLHDSSSADVLKHTHWRPLTDAVNPVYRLILCRRIPLGIQQMHLARCNKVEPDSAGLEAHHGTPR